jgi:hypothetical protein
MIKKLLLPILFTLLLFPFFTSSAQFADHFEDHSVEDWDFFTGDGEASMTFTPKNRYVTIKVDATGDKHNVWWAIIKKNVAEQLDLSKLENPDFELRVEAKVRVSEAPRRLNFMVNTQRTTDYHKQLKEFDITDTTNWHVISMTTRDLDAVPGDDLNVQLGVTDWGFRTYEVDIDYYKADIINTKTPTPDKGEPLTYHPSIPEMDSFSNHLIASESAVINTRFPDTNFQNWQDHNATNSTSILSVSADNWVVLKWDFNEFKKPVTESAGILELTTHSIQTGGQYSAVFGEDLGMEFGKVRIIEILGGNPDWTSETVTYSSLTKQNDYHKVFNEQMIFDTEVTPGDGGKTYITLSRPVMQRLLDGTTKGLLLKPLGVIQASFYPTDGENPNYSPKLHFSLKN